MHFLYGLADSGKGISRNTRYGVPRSQASSISAVRVAEILQDEDLNPVVYYEDTEQRKVVSMTLDMVILANACSASKGIIKLAELVGIELDENNFVKTHPNKPLDTSIPGIYTCGCAQGPLDIPESVAQASSAAARAAEVVMTGGQALAV